MKQARPLLVVMLLVVMMGQAGCVLRRNDSGVVQFFDESTGATVVALAKPLIFAAEAPFLASNARDYVYLGPVEVSSGGEKRYYLWVAEWTSIDRQVQTAQRSEHTVFVLMIDGEPMELIEPQPSNRLPWSDYQPYSTPVETSTLKLFRLTRQQLVRVARADVLAIETVGAGFAREHTVWRVDGAAPKNFARYVESGNAADLQVLALGK